MLRGRNPSKHPLLPPDPTPEEYEILMIGISNIYNKVTDPTDKFLIAFVYELQYNQRTAAHALGLSDGAVSKRLERIRKTLTVSYGRIK